MEEHGCLFQTLSIIDRQGICLQVITLQHDDELLKTVNIRHVFFSLFYVEIFTTWFPDINTAKTSAISNQISDY